MPATLPSKQSVRLKTVALPAEHGGWGFLFEPILLGLVIAPTAAGASLALAAIAAFLVRHPLKLFTRHRRDVATSPRYRAAGFVALAYGAIAVAGLAAAVRLAGWIPLIPVAVLSPLTMVFLTYDASNRGRRLAPELCGPAGLAATAPAIALAAGWAWPPVAALWLVLLARAIPSVVYVRARLRMEKKRPTSRWPAIFLHVLSAAVLAALAAWELAPWTAAAALVVLLARAALGLSTRRRFHKARQIGFLELGFGIGYIACAAAGYVRW